MFRLNLPDLKIYPDSFSRSGKKREAIQDRMATQRLKAVIPAATQR
jgi:hypothetical protein